MASLSGSDINSIGNIWATLTCDVYKNGRQYECTKELKVARKNIVFFPPITL